jgi:murein DD-endopeptidase MepM/ murein hydrolase activator NlpD
MTRQRPLPRVLILFLLGSLLLALAVAPSTRAVAGTTWVWPLDPQPVVLAGFDPPDDRWGSGHRGVDLAGYAGQSVRSAGDGVVSFAGMLGGRGVVAVTHGALRTTYLPVDADVSVGQRVEAGDVIGTLGVVGGHCLPRICLHWGLLRGSTYLNPLTLVGAGPIRLLPDSPTVSLRPLFMPVPSAVSLSFVLPSVPAAASGQARGWAWP